MQCSTDYRGGHALTLTMPQAMLKLGKTASYCVYLEAQCCDTEVSVLLKAISMDIKHEAFKIPKLVHDLRHA